MYHLTHRSSYPAGLLSFSITSALPRVSEEPSIKSSTCNFFWPCTCCITKSVFFQSGKVNQSMKNTKKMNRNWFQQGPLPRSQQKRSNTVKRGQKPERSVKVSESGQSSKVGVVPPRIRSRHLGAVAADLCKKFLSPHHCSFSERVFV